MTIMTKGVCHMRKMVWEDIEDEDLELLESVDAPARENYYRSMWGWTPWLLILGVSALAGALLVIILIEGGVL